MYTLISLAPNAEDLEIAVGQADTCANTILQFRSRQINYRPTVCKVGDLEMSPQTFRACISRAYISYACVPWACTLWACILWACISWPCISWPCTSQACISSGKYQGRNFGTQLRAQFCPNT